MERISLLTAALLWGCSDYNLHAVQDVNGLDDYGMLGPVSDGDASVLDGDAGFGDRAGADGDTGLTADDVEAICDIAVNLTGYLDDFQTPDDGQVLFCHSGSGNGYILVDSDIDSCSAHLDHSYDVFPSTGCDS